MKRVAITGCAFVSPFGSELETFWRGICHGPGPVSSWTSEPAFPGLSCQLAGLPAGLRPPQGAPLPEAVATLLTAIGRQALDMAGYASPPPGSGLAFGSLWGEHDYFQLPRRQPPPSLLARLASALSLTGPVINTSVACAGGNAAIGWAFDRVRAGEVPCMLAGGLDLAGPLGVGGYEFLGTLTENRALPFAADRDGFLLGEGGALFVLEPLERAKAEGRPILAEVCGVGGGHDAVHPTRPDAEGRGSQLAMRAALADAGLGPEQIGYLNAHAPGTQANDPGETAAIQAVFGPAGVPVSSTKAALGHAQGGANALEALACLLALRHQCLPPTLCLESPDPDLAALDYVIGPPRPHAFDYALSLASSMGGATWALVFGRSESWV